jgi:hypothetical protein
MQLKYRYGIGDIVRVKTGLQAGKNAEVIAHGVYNDRPLFSVHFPPHATKWHYITSELELVKSAAKRAA